MMETGLLIARFLHYAAVMALFGVLLFPLYAYWGITDREPVAPRSWFRPVEFGLAVVALGSAVFWLALVAANMAGVLSAAVDPEVVQAVLSGTLFGQVWAARLVLAALLVGLTGLALLAPKKPLLSLSNILLSGVLLATLAGTGHTMHSQGMARALHIAADCAHLLAAGAWFGGLFALGNALAAPAPNATRVLQRFSGMGYVAVATLIGSGLLNSWYLVGSISNLLTTPYGQLLIVKLGLFAGMLALAAANRFWLVPALSRDSSQALIAGQRLRRHVIAEQALGFLVIVIVSLLGTLEPAIGHS